MSLEIESTSLAITQYLLGLILFFIFTNRAIGKGLSVSGAGNFIFAFSCLILAGFYSGPKALEKLLELLK
jgi:hypothetical protein